MHFRKLLCRLLVCLAFFAVPAILHAQFQQPTDEELKMTAEPKAPGASAIFLDREMVTDDFNHFYGYYNRVKVLTEKGKELATVHIPYARGLDKVTDIQGRTIHADGTVVPLTAKPTDLMEVKGKDFQLNEIVFTLPSVEVGSILEYRMKVRAPDSNVSQPVWDIQLPYFTRKAHFSFHPFLLPGHYISDNSGQTLTRLMYLSHLDTDQKLAYEQTKDVYSLDLADIPALPEDDWMPPLNSLKWRVEFYYTNSITSGEFWQNAAKHWAKQAEEFTNPGGGLKDAVAGIVAPGDSDEQKARKIYAAVQKLDNTSFSRRKSEEERKKEGLKEIHNAEDVWKQQSGSGDDIALLYIALGRAAGLKVYPAQVVNRDRAIFDTRYLSVRQLNDYLAIVVLDGKEVYLDPGQRMCPFGSLHWKHTLASGFRLTDKDPAPVTTPGTTYKAAVVQRVAQLFIDSTGTVTGSVRLIMSGPDALHWRQLTLKSDPDEVKKQFNESMQDEFPEGVQADFDHFLALDDYTVNLIGVVKVSGNLGTATGKRFFLPGLFFESRGKHPFAAQEKRTTPVDVHYAKMEEDDVTYHLPSGFTVESVPQAANAAWPERAVLKIGSAATADSINVKRTLAYNFTLLDPRDYGSLHDFYQKVATADQQQLVLTRAPAASGN
jgi:hypothetical protein